MMYHTEVFLDADENRVVWQVAVYDENGDLVAMQPFRDKQDAEEYAEHFGVE